MKKWMKIMVSLMLSIAFAVTMLGCEDAAVAADFEIIEAEGVPTAVAYLDLTMMTAASIGVKWGEVVNASDYEVEYNINGVKSVKTTGSGPGSGLTDTITGLSKDDVVTVSVRALTEEQNDETGELEYYKKGPIVSKTLKMAKPEISGLTATATAGTITLGWNAAANKTLTYEYRYIIASRAPGDGLLGSGTTTSATGVVIPNLSPNKTYNIQVTATNTGDFFDVSTPLMTNATTSSKMDTPVLTIFDLQNFTVTWNPIDGATHYDLYYGEGTTQGKVNEIQVANSNNREEIFTIPVAAVRVGKKYTMWVVARNSDTGEVSDAGSVSGTIPALIKPVVRELAGTVHNSFEVVWDALYALDGTYSYLIQESSTITPIFSNTAAGAGAGTGTGTITAGTGSVVYSASASKTYNIWVKMAIGEDFVISDPITVTTPAAP